MRAALDGHELRVGRVDELLDLLLRVGDGVDDILGSLLGLSACLS